MPYINLYSGGSAQFPIFTALDNMVPHAVLGGDIDEVIKQLKNNNFSLANSVLNLYYRIKKNVEYISQGKESLHSTTPHYKTSGNNSLNARSSRQYFALIHNRPNMSFGAVVNLAAYIIQNNKLRLEQNTKGLQGYKLL
jgi:hypothetical protein